VRSSLRRLCVSRLSLQCGKSLAAKWIATVALCTALAAPVCRAQTSSEFAVLGVSNMTKSSSGLSMASGTSGVQFLQSSESGFGESAEFAHWWSSNGFLFGFSRTPTNSVLITGNPASVAWRTIPAAGISVSPDDLDTRWALERNEFNTLYARRFRERRKSSLRLMAGLTSILLDGGKASGLDRQFAAVVGAGNDYRLTSRLALRCEFLTNFMRASNYSDSTYQPSRTVMLETRWGLVWRLGRGRSE
jgi:hypothetical protein